MNGDVTENQREALDLRAREHWRDVPEVPGQRDGQSGFRSVLPAGLHVFAHWYTVTALIGLLLGPAVFAGGRVLTLDCNHMKDRRTGLGHLQDMAP